MQSVLNAHSPTLTLLLCYAWNCGGIQIFLSSDELLKWRWMYKNLKLRNYFKPYIVEWNCAVIVRVEKEAFLLFETAVYIALYILLWEMGLR